MYSCLKINKLGRAQWIWTERVYWPGPYVLNRLAIKKIAQTECLCERPLKHAVYFPALMHFSLYKHVRVLLQSVGA